ncbi:uncharacterized protein ColSpa_06299 [Colletotrichum spaethianum]|uniref:Yeast cell wall synthesis Kre9/Knh1-like N-terminal domain-containing protein n=1 Tax=Colletotrichum spaethianum TaxID=700344 RepID=A0AA37P2A0_9PEZI|nr:uncharacterized protein ColSpa_06299 [Colletotrichum spaethianum]GKT46118.1 hypothetical protein ColSpa_06299 [Colletotrichum spaethianum]
MRFFAVALALAAPLVSAIEFTSPSLNSTVTKGSSYELTWNTVDTDPSAFSIFLVNFVNWPPSYTLLAQDIETAAGAVSVEVPCSTLNSYGYQFLFLDGGISVRVMRCNTASLNEKRSAHLRTSRDLDRGKKASGLTNHSNAINGTNVYVIYAQTPKFSISGADCTGPTTLPPASPSTCAPPSTVTVTVSKTLSKNSTATATGGFSAAQSMITTSAAVSASSAPVFHGTCPDTIGWASDYHHPVTLTKPPHHPNDTRYPQPTKAPYPTGDEDVTTIYHTTYLPLELAPTGACTC